MKLLGDHAPELPGSRHEGVLAVVRGSPDTGHHRPEDETSQRDEDDVEQGEDPQGKPGVRELPVEAEARVEHHRGDRHGDRHREDLLDPGALGTAFQQALEVEDHRPHQRDDGKQGEVGLERRDALGDGHDLDLEAQVEGEQQGRVGGQQVDHHQAAAVEADLLADHACLYPGTWRSRRKPKRCRKRVREKLSARRCSAARSQLRARTFSHAATRASGDPSGASSP